MQVENGCAGWDNGAFRRLMQENDKEPMSWRSERSGAGVLVVDRLEGDTAVIEYCGKTYTFPRALMPKEVREGDVVTIAVSIDRTETMKRHDRITRLMDDLFE